MNSMPLCLPRFVATAVCMAAVALLFGDESLASDKGDVEAEVARIRKFYAEVEALQELDKEDFEFKCPGDPMEGVLTRRSRRDTGKVVRLDLGYIAGDHSGSDEMYYYREGKLFFVMISDSWWQFSGKKEGQTIDTMRERRYYFSEGQSIRVLEKKVSAEKPDLLRGLIVKAENSQLDRSLPTTKEMVAEVMKKALALPKMHDAKAVTKFFCE